MCCALLVSSNASDVSSGFSALVADIWRLSKPRPRIRRDYPLNLSISVSGGKETNKDSPSSGERTGMSPAPNPVVTATRKCGV